MTYWRDKEVGHFLSFLLIFILLLLLSGIGLNAVQTNAVKELYVSHDRAVVSSLLAQGVSKEVIATAITNETNNQEGSVFLSNIGITEATAVRFLPEVFRYQQKTGLFMLFPGILFSFILVLGAGMFFGRREKLYQTAEQVIVKYMEGDYSCHMPQMKEGSIYRLFSLVEQLAIILKSKNESEHRIKDFLKNTIADISHQLKTPLAALILYNEIILEEPKQLGTVQEYSEKTGLALKRMEQLILSMLKITRLDAGNIIFEKEDCRLTELISQSYSELTSRALEEGKEIRMDGPTDITVLCDKQWTSEAIGNIIKNSLDHTGDGGIIRIFWERTPAMIRIHISDNGTGISPEDLHHIFKRFYRSKKSLDTQGIGLGLSLAKSIVEGQNGVISVHSDSYGTTFSISFLTEM